MWTDYAEYCLKIVEQTRRKLDVAKKNRRQHMFRTEKDSGRVLNCNVVSLHDPETAPTKYGVNDSVNPWTTVLIYAATSSEFRWAVHPSHVSLQRVSMCRCDAHPNGLA